jgi:cephalosporin hydroxylase
MNVTGHAVYRGYVAQQHENAFEVFRSFLTEIKPKQILEIGTAGGGFTLFLRDVLNTIGLENTKIKSFEVLDQSHYNDLRNQNIEILLENIFDHSYLNLERPELIQDFIQSEGTTLVLCDGGHKIYEFIKISPLLKVGDFIMAHDYVDTWENYKENYVDKIWNWCEIEEKYISEVSIEQNLIHYNKETFDKVVWVCKQKMA